MDSYSNKINRIKYTIDEIRDDIEKMKTKNEKTINTMMTSIKPGQVKKEQGQSYDIERTNEEVNKWNQQQSDLEMRKDYEMYDDYNSKSENWNKNPPINNQFKTMQTLSETRKEELFNKYDNYESQEYQSNQINDMPINKNIKIVNEEEEYEKANEINKEDNPGKSGKNRSTHYNYNNYSNNKMNYSNEEINEEEQITLQPKYINKEMRNSNTTKSHEKLTNKYLGQAQNKVVNPHQLRSNLPVINKDNILQTPETEIQNYSSNQNMTSSVDPIILKYQSEIAQLQVKIAALEQKSVQLTNDLEVEQNNNDQLFKQQKEWEENDNGIITGILEYLGMENPEDIIPTINELLNKTNNTNPDNKLRDEWIEKLKSLYLNWANDDKKEEEIEIKELWRWIRHVISTVTNWAREKENNLKTIREWEGNYECKEYCIEWMQELNWESLEELKSWITSLWAKNNWNNKRSEKLKKMLWGHNNYNNNIALDENNYYDRNQNEMTNEIEGMNNNLARKGHNY